MEVFMLKYFIEHDDFSNQRFREVNLCVTRRTGIGEYIPIFRTLAIKPRSKNNLDTLFLLCFERVSVLQYVAPPVSLSVPMCLQ